MVKTPIILLFLLVAGIWLIVEFKRFKHKIFAVFLIVLILLTYFSFNTVIVKNNIDLKTSDGIKEAGHLYLVWLGGAFNNVKEITANAVHLDWGVNESLGSIEDLNVSESLNLSSSSN